MALVWINGKFVDESNASVSLRDTGLLHASGVFTTMRAVGGRVFRLQRHLERLRASCDVLFVPLQYKEAALIDVVSELLARNELSDARLRLTVTRGQSSHDPVSGLRLEPSAFLTATSIEPYPSEFYQRGMTVMVLDEQKLNPYDMQAGHKTLNYFSRLSALREATRRGAGEALWFNTDNYLQSGSISNVFLVREGVLLTPPTALEMRDKALRESMPFKRSAVLPGITRGAVIDIAKERGIEVRFAAIDVETLLAADEVFLTNSAMYVMPVNRIEQHVVGEDRPGEVTSAISERLMEMVAAE